MIQDVRVILAVASRVLGYPNETFALEEQEMNDLIEANMESDDIKQELEAAYTPLFRLPPQVLRETYVATFDLKSKLGLYLTAHELGDSTKRGAALIKLQKIIQQAGYERDEDELADYIPMLFEFLAASPESSDHERIYKRLAVAVHRMLSSIDPESPYAGTLKILMKYVFPRPTKETLNKLEFEREEADLEEMPYPIMYQ